MYVLIDSGISSVQTTPNSFALIQIINVCMIVRNLSFLTSEPEIDLVYLSANSHAVTKSMHFTPKTDNNCSKKIQVCALTGCAAILLQCNARTIHSWSGIKLANGEIEDIVDSIANNKYQRKTWRSTQVLIIDEVSMMSKKIFNLLNIVAKTCRNNIKPFGNMQIIFLGDFYQLPPVNKSDDEDNNKFCFESEDWFNVFPKNNHILLTKIFRQDDNEYKNILMNIRKGVFAFGTELKVD